MAAKQNQKFPFHFCRLPPHPPAEENKKGKENFWFLLPRPKGADEARIILHQDSIQNTFELRLANTANSDFQFMRREGVSLLTGAVPRLARLFARLLADSNLGSIGLRIPHVLLPSRTPLRIKKSRHKMADF